MSPLLVQAIYIICILGAIAYGIRGGLPALCAAYVFSIPWFGALIDVGLTLTIDRFLSILVFGAGLVLGIVLRVRLLLPLLLYPIVITAALSFHLPDTARDYSPLRGEYRWIAQSVFWTVSIGAAMTCAAIATPATVRRLYRSLVWSISLLAALALAQAAIYYGSGIDIFPIALFHPGQERTALHESMGSLFGTSTVFRATALGGEPKHLAYSLTVALTLLLADSVFGGVLDFGRRSRRWLIVLCSLALVATLSTQGYVMVAVNATIVLVAGMAGAQRDRRDTWRALLLVAGLATALLTAPGMLRLIEERTTLRLAESGAVEDFNETILAWAKENPEALVLGVGLGNVHLYAREYIPEEYRYYMWDSIFVAKSGALRLATEIGVLGLAMTLFLGLHGARMIKAASGGNSNGLLAAQPVLLLIIGLDFLASADGPVYLFLFLALTLGVANWLKRSEHVNGLVDGFPPIDASLVTRTTRP